LTNTERKFIHQLAGQVGVVSKSTGKGENRRIAVTKRKDVKKTTGDDESMPILRIGNKGIDALRKHIVKFPPTHTEDLESRDTGASLVEALARQSDQDDGGGDNVITETLNQLGLGDSREARQVHHRRRPVNLKARKARHAEFQREKKQQLSSKDKFQKLLQSRSKLPAYDRQEEIVSIVAANPVTIIQGETGCGKSTQCPQFILDANPTANIIVTQRTYTTIGPCLFVCSLVRSC
jgi:chromosomal replication initiation ATPase DnaA